MDNDVYGHVNNVTYYSYFDTVVNQHLIAAGVLDVERSPVFGVVVETGCRFFSSLTFPRSSTPGCASPGSAATQRPLRDRPVRRRRRAPGGGRPLRPRLRRAARTAVPSPSRTASERSLSRSLGFRHEREDATSRTSSRTAASSPTASSAPPRAACCARSGMGDDDWRKPQIGVASSWNEITPCNLSLEPAGQGGQGRRARGAAGSRWSSAPSRSPTASRWATTACTTRWSRARSSPTPSRRCSAPSGSTARVLLAGCDKSLPGMLMAAARLDVAAVFLYAGSTLPGRSRRPRRHDHRRVRGGRRVPRRPDHAATRSTRSRGRSARARVPAAACTPPTRWPSRGRGARHVAARARRRRRRLDRRRDGYAERVRRGRRRARRRRASPRARS